MRRVERRFWISAVSIYEIDVGRHRLQRRGQAQRGAEIASLLKMVTVEFADFILAFDARVALAAAELGETLRSESIDAKDLFIAATAQVHDLTIVTRNLRHFERTGVPVIDPASDASWA